MTDKEIIEKVFERYGGYDGSDYRGDIYYIERVLVRYTGLLRRAKSINEVFEEIEDYEICDPIDHSLKGYWLSVEELQASKQRLLGGEQ